MTMMYENENKTGCLIKIVVFESMFLPLIATLSICISFRPFLPKCTSGNCIIIWSNSWTIGQEVQNFDVLNDNNEQKRYKNECLLKILNLYLTSMHRKSIMHNDTLDSLLLIFPFWWENILCLFLFLFHCKLSNSKSILSDMRRIEQHVLDTNAGKQQF